MIYKFHPASFVELYTKGTWFKASFLHIFTWLAITMLLVNPPFGDIGAPEIANQWTVLVVDDDPALQTLFKQFLKKAGFGRIVVGSGAEAIAHAEKQGFDLVFLDLKLPDISADEIYAKLKDLHPDLPIVIITGYPDSETLSKILASGPVTVIKKPIEFEQLNRTVKILGHKGAGHETGV